jgi:hypothetical protein
VLENRDEERVSGKKMPLCTQEEGGIHMNKYVKTGE